MLGAGSVKVSWGGTPGGCAKKGEVLRGPEIIVHGGMGGGQGCAEKWGEAGAKSRDLGEEGVPWRKLGPSVPSSNQVPQIRVRKAPLGDKQWALQKP